MRALFFILFSTFLLVACKKKQENNPNLWVDISKRLHYQFNKDFIIIKSGELETKIEKSKLPLKSAIILNSSLTGYFTELNLEDKIIGISSPEYIFSDKMQHLVSIKKIANVGNEQKFDLEKILSLNPDVIFANYVPNFQNTYDILAQNGIKIIFLDEFLERRPLDKSKYLLLFGQLFGAESLAKKKYKEIEKHYYHYKFIASKAAEKPVVISNEMYGNQWFLPGGRTSSAHLINDANANYILREDASENSVIMSFEEVFAKSKDATFWVNVSSHRSKKELLTINPNYEQLNVFKNGTIFMINNREKGRSNDYFISGNVRADWVLKDYIKLFHPEIFPNEALMYFKELK